MKPGPAAVVDENEQNERISLTLPNGARYVTVARIVVGGFAARHNLSYESLDDLQLAVETVLAGHVRAEDAVTLELAVREGAMIAEVGPVDAAAVEEALARDDDLGLRVVLSAVVDEVAFSDRDGTPWLRLEKRVHRLPKS